MRLPPAQDRDERHVNMIDLLRRLEPNHFCHRKGFA
jgi:hypothetical protein